MKEQAELQELFIEDLVLTISFAAGKGIIVSKLVLGVGIPKDIRVFGILGPYGPVDIMYEDEPSRNPQANWHHT